jgi:predicted AAA+ superfamily ATPase
LAVATIRISKSPISSPFRRIRNITDLTAFQRFVRLCAGRIGQLLNFTSLATECGVDTKTAQAWMSVLEAGYIVFFLRPHHRNFNKRIVKQPKLYFCDTGLACALLGIMSANQVETHYLRGSLFENLVILDFLKTRLNQGLPSNLYFWRDHIGHEVDLLMDEAGTLHPVEIKSGATVTSDYTTKLARFCRLSGIPPEQATVVYGGERSASRTGFPIKSWRDLELGAAEG